MDNGTYQGRRLDISRYAASLFNPFLFSDPIRAVVGCGATALATLTGVAPEIIAEKNRGSHFSDAFMIRFLRSRGFKVARLTVCNLAAARSKIGNAHVLLISQMFRKREGTWGIIYRRMHYHNFDIYTLEALSFLNKPLLSAYLVMHPSWNLNYTPRGKSSATTNRPASKPFSA